MEKGRAIPQGYMTVGEVAKKMGVTVRTMQYYHKEGLLSPSCESEGGRRLYTYKDVVKLHQILAMKHLGFSLDDIKNWLMSLDSPEDIEHVLSEQAAAIKEKIEILSVSLKEIEALKAEVVQMGQVDFKKYADIVVNLQMENEAYQLIKYFDDDTLNHLRSRFDKDSGQAMLETFTKLRDQAIQLQKDGVLPESEKGQAFAKAFWDMVTEFTNGDGEVLSSLMKLGDIDGLEQEWGKKQEMANAFIEPALDAYFTALNYNPLEGTK